MRTTLFTAIRYIAIATALVMTSVSADAAPVSSPKSNVAPMPGTLTTRPAAMQVHRAIVACEPAFFYVWPDENSAPSRTAYPPGRVGDAFDVIGDGTLAHAGLTLYETTIDVYSPFGAGKHYWVSAECVNAG